MKSLRCCLLCIFLLFLFVALGAQNEPEWQWAVQAEGVSNDCTYISDWIYYFDDEQEEWDAQGSGDYRAWSSDTDYIEIDQEGNCYIVGRLFGNARFGDACLSSDNVWVSHAFICKLDYNGNFLWAKDLGFEGNEYLSPFSLDKNGNCYFMTDSRCASKLGAFTLDWPDGSGSFVCKLDTDGNFLWASQLEEIDPKQSLTFFENIVVDEAENFYVYGEVDREPHSYYEYNRKKNTEGFIQKYDEGGRLIWHKYYGGNEGNFTNSVDIDTYGNAYLTGTFSGSLRLGTTTLRSQGSDDVFVCKMDASGNFLWAVQSKGEGSCQLSDIAIDTFGNCHLIGTFNGSVQFGSTTLKSRRTDDIFICKLDTSGKFLWATQSEVDNISWRPEICVGKGGEIFATGPFSGRAKFGATTLYSLGEDDTFICKLGSGGEFLWAQQFGLDHDYSTEKHFGVDDAGNSYLSGKFKRTAKFGSHTLISSGYIDFFICKLDTDGNFVWAQRAGGKDHDQCSAIAVSGSGNCYLTGFFSYEADFGSLSLTSSPYQDLFFTMIDTEGEFRWATRAGEVSSIDCGFCIAVDNQANSYVVGEFQYTVSFGGTILTSVSCRSTFVCKLDSDGNFIWARQIEGADCGYKNCIAADDEGNVYVTGSFYKYARFGTTTLTGRGRDDVFICKLNTNGKFLWAVQAGGEDDDRGRGIAVDKDGNVYVTGYFSGTANFGSKTLNSVNYLSPELFVCKLDKNGKFIWTSKSGKKQHEFKGYGIAVDKAGNIYIAGEVGIDSTTYTGVWNRSMFCSFYRFCYVCKLDKSGRFIWEKILGEDNPYGYKDFGSGVSIDVDDEGNSYVAGCFLYYDTIGSNDYYGNDDRNALICKLDVDGNVVWMKKSSGEGSSECNSIRVDKDGNCYVLGDYKGELTLDFFALEEAKTRDIFACKLDKNGHYLWVKTAAGSATGRGQGLALDKAENIYITGLIFGETEFGEKSLKSTGDSDIFVAKLASLKAGFSADKRKGNKSLLVKFTDLTNLGAHPVVHWFWTFGDGVTSTEQNPMHLYTSPGIYTVSLTVLDSSHKSSTFTQKEYINITQ